MATLVVYTERDKGSRKAHQCAHPVMNRNEASASCTAHNKLRIEKRTVTGGCWGAITNRAHLHHSSSTSIGIALLEIRISTTLGEKWEAIRGRKAQAAYKETFEFALTQREGSQLKPSPS